MQLSRTKSRKSFILSTKKWIKCFPGKNPVNSSLGEKSGDITTRPAQPAALPAYCGLPLLSTPVFPPSYTLQPPCLTFPSSDLTQNVYTHSPHTDTYPFPPSRRLFAAAFLVVTATVLKQPARPHCKCANEQTQLPGLYGGVQTGDCWHPWHPLYITTAEAQILVESGHLLSACACSVQWLSTMWREIEFLGNCSRLFAGPTVHIDFKDV